MFVGPTVAQACAVCVGSEDYGYFWGVLFLMSMPFIIGSSIGGWLLYIYRRAQPGLAPSASSPRNARRLSPPTAMQVAADGCNDAAQAQVMSTVAATTDH
jgi:hypothetical protein